MLLLMARARVQHGFVSMMICRMALHCRSNNVIAPTAAPTTAAFCGFCCCTLSSCQLPTALNAVVLRMASAQLIVML
jgi:hypothetical protein